MHLQKYIFISLAFILFYLNSKSQVTDSTYLENDINITQKKQSSNETVCYVGIDYASDRAFQGKRATSSQAYLKPNVSVYLNNGIYFYFDAVRILANKENWDQLTGSIGYNKKLSKRYSFLFNYTYTHYNINSTQVNSSLANTLEASLKAKYKIITTRLTYDYFWGTSSDHYLTLDFYHYFDIDNIFTENNDGLRIRPIVSLIAGTTEFFETYKVGKGKKGSKNIMVSVPNFSVLNYNLGLNLPYTYKDFTIEPVVSYNIPVTRLKPDFNNSFSVFRIYLYYAF